MSRRRLFELLVLRWGFAALVAMAIAAGLVAAMTVAPPADVPGIALQAPVVYRLEVGAAVFLGLYLATLAFALALQNRGFTEIGSGGFRARDLNEAPAVAIEVESTLDLIEEVRDLQAWRERSEHAHR